ncbi:MAG: FG-GAP repeat protein, partial [Candidatus Thermoplasmatota archaeon]
MSTQHDACSREKRNVSSSQPQSIKHINWSETTKILASDGEANDGFGISVAIDGDFCVVGARDDDGERGSASVFRYDGAQWVPDQKLYAADGIAGDWFGISVAIRGDCIFVGADADDNENGLNAGSVYVFRYDGALWLQQDMLVASDGTANDYFGRYISLDETHAVIGAYYDNDITGSAYVFIRIGDDWVEEEKLIASDGQPGDYFGISTAIHDDYAAIGAYRDDNDNGIDAGSVYLFKRTRNGWVQEEKLLASDGASSDRFGISVALDTEQMIIGAYYDD